MRFTVFLVLLILVIELRLSCSKNIVVTQVTQNEKNNNTQQTSGNQQLEVFENEKPQNDVNYVESRKKKKNNNQDILSRILPMLVMPFMMSVIMLPMALTSMKFSLLRGLVLGKLAIILAIINLVRNMRKNGGVYSHNVHMNRAPSMGPAADELTMSHYGYTGGDEYGAYVNKRRKRAKIS